MHTVARARNLLAWLMLTFGSLPAQSVLAQAAATHPLDPLTAEEMRAAVAALRGEGKTTGESRFVSLALHEPPKAEVTQAAPGSPMRREAFAVVYERETNRTFEAVVDVRRNRVLSWKAIPGVQPAGFVEDFALAAEIVKADPGWQAAMRKRGITNFDQVAIDAWPGLPGAQARMVQAVSFLKGRLRNYFARPIEGVVAHVNLNTRRVERLEDTGVVPVPRLPAEYDPASVGTLRPAPKPLQIGQPEGASFTVRGQEVRWQNWQFRFGLNAREGLVLYTVGYEDGGKLRPVLYRASVSEMFVPYGDPSPAWRFRKVYDEGGSGLGWLSLSLVPGADAPAHARFFDVTLSNERGEPYEMPRAIALYERDGGLLWRHTDLSDFTAESRRARQLVLATIATVGNYDYGFQWVFHQDGTLEQETLLTGLMQTKGVRRATETDAADGPERYGALVMPQLEAVNHQHFFNFRLDLDVDGPENCIKEMNTEAAPAGPNNPQANAILVKQTTLATETQAKRTLNLASHRCWAVVNCAKLNALGRPTGYLLLPGENTVPFTPPGSLNRQIAGFTEAHFWGTAYDPAQRYAAGDYPVQSKGEGGLPAWIQANRPIENADVVAWYTMGVMHHPRPEDWPIMPVHKLGFKLVPMGFFTRNPALDVPPTR